MNRLGKNPPWFDLAAARTKEHFTGTSDHAAATERRVLEAVTRRKRKPRALWLIPLTLAGSGSLAWAEEVELAVQWTVEHVQELVQTQKTDADTAIPVEVKRSGPPRRKSPPAAALMGPAVEPTDNHGETPALDATSATITDVSPKSEANQSLTVATSHDEPRLRKVEPSKESPGSLSAQPSDLERYSAGYAAQYERHDYRAAVAAWDDYLARVSGGRFTPDVRYHRALALAELGRAQEALAALRPFAAGAYGPLRQQSAEQLIRKLDAK